MPNRSSSTPFAQWSVEELQTFIATHKQHVPAGRSQLKQRVPMVKTHVPKKVARKVEAYPSMGPPECHRRTSSPLRPSRPTRRWVERAIEQKLGPVRAHVESANALSARATTTAHGAAKAVNELSNAHAAEISSLWDKLQEVEAAHSDMLQAAEALRRKRSAHSEPVVQSPSHRPRLNPAAASSHVLPRRHHASSHPLFAGAPPHTSPPYAPLEFSPSPSYPYVATPSPDFSSAPSFSPPSGGFRDGAAFSPQMTFTPTPPLGAQRGSPPTPYAQHPNPSSSSPNLCHPVGGGALAHDDDCAARHRQFDDCASAHSCAIDGHHGPPSSSQPPSTRRRRPSTAHSAYPGAPPASPFHSHEPLRGPSSSQPLSTSLLSPGPPHPPTPSNSSPPPHPSPSPPPFYEVDAVRKLERESDRERRALSTPPHLPFTPHSPTPIDTAVVSEGERSVAVADDSVGISEGVVNSARGGCAGGKAQKESSEVVVGKIAKAAGVDVGTAPAVTSVPKSVPFDGDRFAVLLALARAGASCVPPQREL